MRSNKPDGMGIGVFLAHASFERLGGEVSLVNRQGGGVLATVKLPWPVQEGSQYLEHQTHLLPDDDDESFGHLMVFVLWRDVVGRWSVYTVPAQ